MRTILLIIMAAMLASCGHKKPLPSMAALCTEFAAVKIMVAQQVDVDAQLDADKRVLEKKDLLSIKQASDTMTDFCPPPVGYEALTSTVRISMTMMNVLNNYLPGRI